MIAKRRNDLCLRALGVYQDLEKKLHPKVRFGFIDVLKDEGLKVAFGEESVPWTFAVFEGRAYKYYALERPDELEEYLNDLERWKTMRIQFEVPERPADALEIILFDIKKELRRRIVPLNRAYMEWFHKMRTGSSNNFEESTVLGFSCLGIAVVLVLAMVAVCCKKLCCGRAAKDLTKSSGHVAAADNNKGKAKEE